MTDQEGIGLFRCDVRYIQGRAVIVVTGDIDLATAPSLLRETLATLALPVTEVSLDLRRVEFLDSSGIDVFVQARTHAQERGITFRLVAVPPQARKVIQVTGLTETFGLAELPDTLDTDQGAA